MSVSMEHVAAADALVSRIERRVAKAKKRAQVELHIGLGDVELLAQMARKLVEEARTVAQRPASARGAGS